MSWMSCDIRLPEMCSAAIGLYSKESVALYLLLARLFIAPVAIVGLVFMCVAVLQATALHFNVRCLLTCMLTSMIISNMGVLATALYVLYIVFFIPDDVTKCDRLVYSPSTCLRLRQIWSTGGFALALSALAVAFERIIATLRFNTYEKRPLKWVGVILVIVQLGVVSWPILAAPPQLCMPYCVADLVYPDRSRIAGDVIFSFNFICLAIFFCLWLVNRKRKVNSGQNALSRKFQLKENVSTARLMVPVMIIVALMTLSNTIIFHLYLPIFQSNEPFSPAILSAIVRFGSFHEYQVSLMPLLSLMMLFLLPYCSFNIKRALYRLVHIHIQELAPENVPAEIVKEMYFEQLRGQWEHPHRA